MKLAHLADVHLGFRQYHRLTPRGINQREADVAGAFRRTVEAVARAAPDLVVVAGDLFHSVRPPNPAILDSFDQLRRLREALPRAPVVIVAGNHDTPRSVETGTILKLFEAVDGVHVVADAPRVLTFPEHDLAVTCVPHAALVTGERPQLTPRTEATHHVLVTHTEVAGILPREAYIMEYGGALVEPGDLHADEWDYVALGHYHVAHQVSANAWYAGALEYVSPNIWGELEEEERAGRRGQKGWLLVELGDRPAVRFCPVPLAREVVDLEPIHAAGLGAEAVDREIAARLETMSGEIDGKIVRQVVFDIPRAVARDLDHGTIRSLKARALHYHLDLRRPPPSHRVGVGAPGTRQTLMDIVADYLRRRPLPADVDRQALLTLGRSYMEAVEQDALEE